MLKTGVALAIVGYAGAFAPAFTPQNALSPKCMRLRPTSSLCSITMQHAGKPIDRVDGFGGGYEAVLKTVEQRSKDDWGGGKGTGGASGKLPDGPASFEEYMKKRAQMSGGKVMDAAGNDITNARPSHKVGVGAWGAPKDMEKQEDPLAWVDKSVVGFQKQDTNDLLTADAKKWRDEKSKQQAEKSAEIEAKMQMWLKAAAEKKAKEAAEKAAMSRK